MAGSYPAFGYGVVMRETDIYPPIKAFLQAQGYTVKAEIGAADVVAMRGDDAPLVVELKTSFALALFHQCVARQAVTDDVYLAVPRQPGKRFAKSLKENVTLARRLSLGVITVRLSDGLVEVHCDPGPYRPRKSRKRQQALLREFARRKGDPNAGGQTRQGLVTAYRQDATRIAFYLFEAGASKGADVAHATGVKNATRMMRDNHYNWFEKVATGVYALTSSGTQAVAQRPRISDD